MNEAVRTLAEFRSHFWTSTDPRYLDYTWTFDVQHSPLLLLPGTTGALGLAAPHELNKLAWCLVDALLALELFAHTAAACQNGKESFHAAEEQRHASAVARYRDARWGSLPTQVPVLWSTLSSMATNRAQLLEAAPTLEVVALSLLGLLHSKCADPLLVRTCSFIIADEVAHASFQSATTLSATHISRFVEALASDCANALERASIPALRALILEYAPIVSTSTSTSEKEEGGPCTDVDASALGARGELLRRIGLDAAAFLNQLNDQMDGVDGSRATPPAVVNRRNWRMLPTNPPPTICIEWLVAGLRSMSGSL